MLTAADVDHGALTGLLARFGLNWVLVPPKQAIPGSYWGEPEAGLIGHSLYARIDTPLHSVLHEAAHFICMTPARRAQLQRDAGGDDAEECAVCYLQILLAEPLPGVGRECLCADMDAWGYSFRLGSAQQWFAHDAADAHAWLLHHGLIDAHGALRGRVRD